MRKIASVSPCERYGSWTVISVSLRMYSGVNRLMALCRCDCGIERHIMPYMLVVGDTTQCRRCSNLVKLAKRHASSHRGSETRLYSIWGNMRGRCRNPEHQDYKRYGGRGISVCAAWNDFPVFREWAEANGYRQGLTIDRRDNDGNYEPGNCHWTTRTAQNRNRRDNQRFDWRGKHLMLSEIAEATGISHDLLRQRVRRDGWEIERALATPAINYHPTGGI